jgi:transcriptional regulator with XRE-family HTH domain
MATSEKWRAYLLEKMEIAGFTTQAALARRGGFSASTVNNWHKYGRLPDPEHIMPLAEALVVSPFELCRVVGLPLPIAEGDHEGLLATVRQLSPQGRAEIERYVRFRHEEERQQAAHVAQG